MLYIAMNRTRGQRRMKEEEEEEEEEERQEEGIQKGVWCMLFMYRVSVCHALWC